MFESLRLIPTYIAIKLLVLFECATIYRIGANTGTDNGTIAGMKPIRPATIPEQLAAIPEFHAAMKKLIHAPKPPRPTTKGGKKDERKGK